MTSVFMTKAEALPASLPILPFNGALLLPRSRLPLNIFEPRYLALVEDALGAGRLIGMVQRQGEAEDARLYGVGCVGRVVSFSETEDNRLLLVLDGVSRFRIGAESVSPKGYRRVAANWDMFADDIDEAEEKIPADLREELLAALRPYFRAHNILANWDTIEEASTERLISSLVGLCPLAVNEKQALLEAADLAARAELLLALLGMATHQVRTTPLAAAGRVRH